mgnify:CR=1 FL=1|tara:strand:+ start:333 stop:758 length:426 start_codon:yes stop_codon:yes gene_type:complete
MSEKFTILAEYIKDMSSETPNIETYLYVKDIITKYNLNILINSTPLKNNLIEVNTKLTYQDPEEGNEKKAYFELIYASVIKVDKEVKGKEIVEQIILVELQKKIFKNIEKAFLNLIHNSGYVSVKWEKTPDFEKLYREKSN